MPHGDGSRISRTRAGQKCVRAVAHVHSQSGRAATACAFLVILAVWQAASGTIVNAYYLSTPVAVLAQIAKLDRERHACGRTLRATLATTLLGFGIAAVVAHARSPDRQRSAVPGSGAQSLHLRRILDAEDRARAGADRLARHRPAAGHRAVRGDGVLPGVLQSLSRPEERAANLQRHRRPDGRVGLGHGAEVPPAGRVGLSGDRHQARA